MSQPREQLGEIIYREALRQVDAQDKRVDEIRNKSAALVPAVGAIVALAASLGGGELEGWWITLAGAALIVAAIAAIRIQLAFGDYRAGPSIEDLCDAQYNADVPATQLLRDLAIYHEDNFRRNEDGPIDRMHFWFYVESASIAAAVGVIIAGFAS